MCQDLSWIEKIGKTKQILFLTTPLIESEKGKKVLSGLSQEDLIGHGAIRRFFGLEQDEGVNSECTDFSNPSNFPTVIVRALKRGERNGFPLPTGLLLKPLHDKYEADRKSLHDKYEADLKPLHDEYMADLKPLHDKYMADRKSLYHKYEADRKPLDDKYWALFTDPANRAKAWR